MKKINLCMLLFLITMLLNAQPPNFTISPSVVCVGDEVSFNYTGPPFSTYFWSFCSANPADLPHADVLYTPEGTLRSPVFIALAKQGTEYFSFVVNHYLNFRRITRIKFGDDILNPNPVVEILPFTLPPEPEGIQVVFDESAEKWFGFVIGGRFSTFPPVTDNRFFIRLEFGNSLNNNPSVDTLTIDPQMQLNFPHDLYVFKDESTGNWFALTVNKGTHSGDIGSITRFNFANGLDMPPLFDNLGNLNNTLVDPVGIFPIKDKHSDDWYLFVTDTDKGLVRVTFPEGLTG
ncbi:MAG TPA: hypothetical protein VLH16_08100, partial [Bacteroidales bacterium]|nr:hypothetical protein [Bacteroidales bacterium]